MNISNYILNFLLPPTCVGCGQYLGVKVDPKELCKTCRNRLSRTYEQFSRVKIPERTGLDTLYACAPYGGEPITTLIHKIKYKDKPWILQSIIFIIKRFADEHLSDLDIKGIIPVPLHPTKLKARGFNQAHSIAAIIAEATDKPCLADLIERQRETSPQMNIKETGKRIENVKNAFSLAQDASAHLKDSIFLLVDDVSTTEATISEAAKVLKRGGAEKVLGFVLAR
ncbi:ComF family protein [Elusimicrobiota bacterium]